MSLLRNNTVTCIILTWKNFKRQYACIFEASFYGRNHGNCLINYTDRYDGKLTFIIHNRYQNCSPLVTFRKLVYGSLWYFKQDQIKTQHFWTFRQFTWHVRNRHFKAKENIHLQFIYISALLNPVHHKTEDSKLFKHSKWDL